MFSMGLIHHLPGPKSIVSFIRSKRDWSPTISFGARASGSPSTAHSEFHHRPPLHPKQPQYQPAITPRDRHHHQPGCSILNTDPRDHSIFHRHQHPPLYHQAGSESSNGTSPWHRESSSGTAKCIQGALERGILKPEQRGNGGRDGYHRQQETHPLKPNTLKHADR